MFRALPKDQYELSHKSFLNSPATREYSRIWKSDMVDFTNATWTLSPHGDYEVTNLTYKIGKVDTYEEFYVHKIYDDSYELLQVLPINNETYSPIQFSFENNTLIYHSALWEYRDEVYWVYKDFMNFSIPGTHKSFTHTYDGLLFYNTEGYGGGHGNMYFFDDNNQIYPLALPNASGIWILDEVFDGGKKLEVYSKFKGEDSYIVDLAQHTSFKGQNLTDFSDAVLVMRDGEVVFANGGDDSITLDITTYATVYGGDGNDVLTGAVNKDFLDGGAGNDVIRGEQTSSDTLSEDTLLGGKGDDTIYGDAGYVDLASELEFGMYYHGHDYILAGEGNDRVLGEYGNDTIHGNEGSDSIYGDRGNDSILGGEGKDSIYGGSGLDTVYGDAGNDYIRGNLGNDLLFGNDGNDLIYGDGWADTLIGGAGADTLFGGSGEDVFTFLTLTDSTFSARDGIRDFVHGEDKIDVRGLGFDGIKNIGDVGAHELRLAYSAATDRTYVRDTASSGFEFFLSGDHRADLTESDFLFV